MEGEGQGQIGLAQVIAPYQQKPSVEAFANALANKAKQDAAKAAQEQKRRADIFKGYTDLKPSSSVRYGSGLDSYKQKVYDAAVQAVKDPSKQLDFEMVKNDYLSLAALAKRNDDLYTQRTNSLLSSGKPIKNENILDDYFKNPIPMDDFSDKNNWSNIFGKDQAAVLDVVPNQYDAYKFNQLVTSKADDFAKFNTKEGVFEIKPQDVTTFVRESLKQDPYAVSEYTDKINKDPELLAKYAGNIPNGIIELASKDFQSLVGKHTPYRGKGQNININIGGNKESVTESVVTEQTRPIGAGGRNVKVRAFLYPKPVDLGARTRVDRMFKIDTNNDTEPVDGTTPPVSYNETIEAPVSTVDVEWTGRDGKKRSIKKGQIVDPADAKAYAEFYTGKQIPTELSLLSFGFDTENNKYYEPAERIAPSSVASFLGADGATAKSQYTKEGIEKTVGVKNTIPTVGGYVPKKR